MTIYNVTNSGATSLVQYLAMLKTKVTQGTYGEISAATPVQPATNSAHIVSDPLLLGRASIPMSAILNVSSAPQDIDNASTLDTPEPAASKKAYDIQANLNIQTERPDISSKYYATKNKVAATATGAVYFLNIDPEKQTALYGAPIDRVMDEQYQKLTQALAVYHGAQVRADQHPEEVDDAKMFVQAALNGLRKQNSYYGTEDYAEEAIYQRSAKELGQGIDMQMLYREFDVA